MRRRTVQVISLALAVGLASACTAVAPGGASREPEDAASGGGGSASGAGSGSAGEGGSSLGAAAAAVSDICRLIPTDLAATLVVGGSAPVAGPEPNLCTVSNGTAVLQIRLSAGALASVEPVNGAEVVAGVGEAAYLERPVPDDAYLTVILATSPNAVLTVEIAGYDGKDHKRDAIVVAQKVIASLR